MNPETLRDLSAEPDDRLLRDFHSNVLSPSFAADELEAVSAMSAGLRGQGSTDLRATVALDEDGAVAAGIVGEVFRGTGVLLLSYLAVRPDRRGRGLGSRLMEEVAQAWYREPEIVLAVGEAHDPRQWPETPDEHPRDRLRLYERLGARLLRVPFTQPALEDGAGRVRGFLLLAFYVAPALLLKAPEGPAIRGEVVLRFVRAYYDIAEGPPQKEDDERASLMETIRRLDPGRILPLSDYDQVPVLRG